MSWMRPVISELASEVGWDDQTNELLVTWKKSGKTSAYAGYDESKADELSRAPSVGQMILSEIKPMAAGHRYVA